MIKRSPEKKGEEIIYIISESFFKKKDSISKEEFCWCFGYHIFSSIFPSF